MPWDEQAGKPASFSGPPRTPLTLLTRRNTSADCAFRGPSSAAGQRSVCSPQSNGSQRSAITMVGCASMLPRVLDNKCGVWPMLCASPVSYNEATWKHPYGRQECAGSPSMTWRSLGGCTGNGSGIPACNAITARGEHQAGHSQGDDGVTPSPGGRRGLAASDLADASQER